MPRERRILGLDLGVASIGWAYLTIGKDENGETIGNIVGANSRIFPAAVEGRGKDLKSKNKARRDARHQRRQHRRKRKRRNTLRRLLMDNGLLPALTIGELNVEFSDMGKFDPYALRAKGLSEKLYPFEIGRAIFHLSKRRGFRSSRLHGKAKEDGPVLKEISEFKDGMAKVGASTPGSYLNALPKKRGSSVGDRRGYMARDDHEKEFDLIWSNQKTFHPHLLTDELHDELWQCIFAQGETRWDRRLIGKCSFDPKKKRCNITHQDAQRFRYWQDINNIRLQNTENYVRRPLTADEKQTLANHLEKKAEKIEISSIPKRLNLSGSYLVNLGNSKKYLYGNRTAAAFRTRTFKKTWEKLSEEDRDDIINKMYRLGDDDEKLRKYLKEKRKAKDSEERMFSDADVDAILSIKRLEQGYSNNSLRAIREMLPFMKQGYRYDEAFRLAKYKRALKSHWSELFENDEDRVANALLAFKGTQTDVTHLKIRYGLDDEVVGKIEKAYARLKTKFDPLGLDQLAPLNENLRNPIVQKALTQVRKVVNELIRTYGKPDEIRVELGRELKMTALQKEEYEKQQRSNERLNREAEEQLMPLNGGLRVTAKQKQMYRLWKEAKEICVYSGETIPLHALVGDHIEIDHIIPYERCWDDSYMNKVICLRRENQAKSNRTPKEHYGGDEERFRQILTRAKSLPEAKRKKFEMTTQEVAEIDWAGRQLSDTRYISKKVREYLIQLFDKAEAVSVVTGQSTELLRRNWGLNTILQPDLPDRVRTPGEKNRRDHRHHAIDAIVVAMTDRPLFNMISTLAGENRKEMNSAFRNFPAPWASFRSDVENAMAKLAAPLGESLEDSITVSHAPTRRARGEYFKQEAYTKLPTGEFVHRVPLLKITAKNYTKIVDPAVRKLVGERLEQFEGKADKAFATPLFHKKKNKDGSPTPIRKVRVVEDKFVESKALAVKDKNGRPVKYYASGGNHHAEIFENIETRERRIKVITLHQAYQNIRGCIERGEIPSPNEWEIRDNERPLFTLSTNDLIEYRGTDGQLRVYRVQFPSQGEDERVFEITIRPTYDGFSELKEGEPIRIRSRAALRNITRKLQADALGRIRRAGD